MFRCSTWLLIWLVGEVISCDTDIYFRCEETGECIENYKVCDGRKDCPFGSDESIVQCKYIDRMGSRTFFCANGAMINANAQCDTVNDCADGSDESPSLCLEDTDRIDEMIRGNCNEQEVECLPGECITKDIVCNGTIECSNGRDESVELCMETCFDDSFQCGNGQCLKLEKVCDDKFDCVDGSDELSLNCGDEKTRRGNDPKKCVEPIERGLRFAGETIYHIKNSTRFVYPNQGVRFECYDRNAKMSGNQWDVCLTTGEWRLGQTECRSKPKNNDPNTNGTYGCPIDTYDENRLKIYKCWQGKCETPVKPPLNNVKVQFICQKGYTLLPIGLERNQLTCRNKEWSSNVANYADPVCVKLCKKEELFCSHSMRPLCSYGKKTSIDCESIESMMPGAIATFHCNEGFERNEQMNELKLQCLDDGSWSKSSDMDQFCQLPCGKQNSTVIAPWSVAIYTQKAFNYEISCGGVRITVDLVLTAAHCVTKNKTKIVLEADSLRVGSSLINYSKANGHYGWAVESIVVNPAYNLNDYDSAILKLHINKDPAALPSVICLPWLHNQNTPKLTFSTNCDVVSWNTIKTNEYMSLNIAKAHILNEVSNADSIRIQMNSGSKICHGNSGSALSSECFNKDNNPTEETCIYGIVSYSDRGLDKDTCSDNVAVSDIRHPNNKEFIEETIQVLSKTCKGN